MGCGELRRVAVRGRLAPPCGDLDARTLRRAVFGVGVRPLFHYIAFGLRIQSEIAFPELLLSEPLPALPSAAVEGRPALPSVAGHGGAEVTIRYGDVPTEIEGARRRGSIVQAAPGRCLLSFDGVGRYLVQEGREITIEPAPDCSEDDIRLFLLGSVMAALLHQRGLLALHGSAVEIGGGAAAFLAPIKHGKSTLAAAFEGRGYRVLTDDVCAILFDASGIPLVLPGFPQIKLWEDSVRQLERDLTSARRLTTRAAKFGVPLGAGFAARPLPLRAVYTLSIDAVPGVTITPIRGKDKLTILIDNTYRFYFLEGASHTKRHFEQCVAVAKAVPVKRVTRPADRFLIEELVDQLQEDLTSEGAKDRP